MGLHVLLVEDDLPLQRQICAQLAEFGHRVASAGDGRAALEAVAHDAFDIVILDWMLPGLSGLEVLRNLRQSGMRVPVLMLTALGQTYDKVEGLDAGADDYVVKPVDPAELNARLNALCRARRASAQAGDTISAANIVISPSQFRAWCGDQQLDLARTEFRLLLALARGAGTVMTRPMLIEQLWGREVAPVATLVDAHIKRLRAKLRLHGKDPISTVRGVGYVIRE
jgi:DNA-binding response OmpR family regulator